jgi:hypothetical protein
MELYVVLAAALGAFLTKLIDWVFNKKSHKEDARTKLIDNEIKLSNQYKDMLDDIEPRYKKQLFEFEERVKANERLWSSKEKLLREEITLLRKENKLLKQQVLEKDRRIKELESR